MKKPSTKNLRVDDRETKRMRNSISSQKSVKITINIDTKTLKELKGLAAETGIPYQRLLNRTLQDGLAGRSSAENRLNQIEKEIVNLKKKIAA